MELSEVQSIRGFKIAARRAVADRILESRLNAFNELNHVLTVTPAWVVSRIATDVRNRPSVAEFLNKVGEMGSILDKNSLHCPRNFRLSYRELISAMMTLGHNWEDGPAMDVNDDFIRDINNRTGFLLQEINGMYLRLPDDITDMVVGRE
ncbi:hypothetical protein [Burkholderia gladioli]|uniref:hypothetical protein n=1 Tax=Burkholderia gladioli TaxID=28095 RepID=UPI00163E1023|nr:hypothetical protein [Burkholderia gladioli]